MSNSKGHILIVDDNLHNLRVTARILQDEGYKISLAQDAKSALAQLEEYSPDLILMDVMMPEIDGLKAVRILKQNDRLKDIPVIFLTAKNQVEDLVDGFSAGGVDYITKPFIREELLMRIKTHIELSLARKKIIDMNYTRGKLYSIISHDLRSPLSNIISLIEAVNEGIFPPGSEEFKELFGELEKRTKSTDTLLNNLLHWTAFQQGKINFEHKNVGLFEEFSQLPLLPSQFLNHKLRSKISHLCHRV